MWNKTGNRGVLPTFFSQKRRQGLARLDPRFARCLPKTNDLTGFTPLNAVERQFRPKRNYLTGFTLIELMVVVFILLTGFVGLMALMTQIFTSTNLIASKLTASHLAQEGIEIVRNIRDSNWFEGGVEWDDGIGEGDWEIDYNMVALLRAYSGAFLNIDTNGLYGYSLGQGTKFRRRISIDKTDGCIHLSVSVIWEQGGKNHEVQTCAELYNWREHIE